MTKPSALTADYVDLKFIRGRGVVQMILEFPIEAGKQIVEAFGTPLPGTGVPVAIARLQEPTKHDEAEKSTQERQRLWDMRPSAQAAILGEDPSFQEWLADSKKMFVTDADTAAAAIRNLCRTTTRAELDKPGRPAERWRSLRDSYQASRLASGHERH